MSESTNKRSRADFEEEVKVDADADADAEETSTKRCKGEAKKQIFDLNFPDETLLETLFLNCSEEGSDVELIHKFNSFVVKVTRIKKRVPFTQILDLRSKEESIAKRKEVSLSQNEATLVQDNGRQYLCTLKKKAHIANIEFDGLDFTYMPKLRSALAKKVPMDMRSKGRPPITSPEQWEWDGILLSFANKSVVCEMRQNRLQKPLWQVVEEIKLMVEEIKLMLQGEPSIFKCKFKFKNGAEWMDIYLWIDTDDNPKVSGYMNVVFRGEDYTCLRFRVPNDCSHYFLLRNGYTFSRSFAQKFVDYVRDTFQHKIIGTVVEETY